MKKRIAFTIFGLLVVVGVLGGVKALQIKDLIAAGEDMVPPPTSVASATAEQTDWETALAAIGTLEAAQGVVITADQGGRVMSLLFDGGETVKAGDVLVEQDVSTEMTQLSSAESDLKLAQSNLDRVTRLFKSKVVSQSDLDTAQSQFSLAEAQVSNISSSIAKKRIVAPFDGRLGLRLVDIGQDLNQGLPIVSLQSIDPMRVNFSLPQQALASVRNGFAVRVTANAVPDVVFDGQITAIDTQIDDATRTVRLQATLDVPDANSGETRLLPGMFANVEVVLPGTKPVLMIPLAAVSFATYGDSVFIIEPGENEQQVARQQFVQLGERRGDFVAVTKGLEAGQTVASDGVFKLRNGAAVMLNNDGKPAPSLEPTPDNA